ncbi:MAG TPA: ABC transporter substrate-binding protein [Micromonosporaceae bacterium]|nr:ABC transporter substrate-binding protein [Micromonosporaceae bacterium]
MTPSRAVAVVAAVAALLVTTACGGKTQTFDPLTAAKGVRLYGSDGNMSNALGEAFADNPGLLAGMKGTAPMTPLSHEFRARLKTMDPTLDDVNYAGEAYDAVMIGALAVQVARTTEGRVVRSYVNGITTATGKDAVNCDSFATCLALIAKGGNPDIRYRGVSLRRGGFTEAGEPSTAMYGALRFSTDNRIDPGKIEFVGAGSEADTTKASPPAPPPVTKPALGTPLVIGSLLPKTGQGAGIYPPVIAGVKLAIQEINRAGGVLGKPVVAIHKDDGTSAEKAKAATEDLINSGVDIIIGAGASSVSKAVLPQVTAAGVLMISPSATSDELTALPDANLFFRTAPPDTLQAKALADVVIRDGGQKLFIVAREDSWGTGLAASLRTDLVASGVKPVNIRMFMYRPGESAEQLPALGTLPDQVLAFQPDGVIILGFDETAHVILMLVRKGVVLRR